MYSWSRYRKKIIVKASKLLSLTMFLLFVHLDSVIWVCSSTRPWNCLHVFCCLLHFYWLVSSNCITSTPTSWLLPTSTTYLSDRSPGEMGRTCAKKDNIYQLLEVLGLTYLWSVLFAIQYGNGVARRNSSVRWRSQQHISFLCVKLYTLHYVPCPVCAFQSVKSKDIGFLKFWSIFNHYLSASLHIFVILWYFCHNIS